MRYELTTTREGKGYQHTLTVSNGDSFGRVMPWDKAHRGKNASMINGYARLNEAQLLKRGILEKITVEIKLK